MIPIKADTQVKTANERSFIKARLSMNALRFSSESVDCAGAGGVCGRMKQ